MKINSFLFISKFHNSYAVVACTEKFGKLGVAVFQFKRLEIEYIKIFSVDNRLDFSVSHLRVQPTARSVVNFAAFSRTAPAVDNQDTATFFALQTGQGILQMLHRIRYGRHAFFDIQFSVFHITDCSPSGRSHGQGRSRSG